MHLVWKPVVAKHSDATGFMGVASILSPSAVGPRARSAVRGLLPMLLNFDVSVLPCHIFKTNHQATSEVARRLYFAVAVN